MRHAIIGAAAIVLAMLSTFASPATSQAPATPGSDVVGTWTLVSIEQGVR